MLTSDYKKLAVWQHSISLANEVYALVKKLPKEENYALSDQMRRSVVSVASNIAEGQGRESHKEFLKFLSISRGSLCELETQLIIAVSNKMLDEKDVEKAMALIDQIGRMIRSLGRYLKGLEK